jgi:hypothetical protein
MNTDYREKNSEVFHTCLGLSLAANNLPIFSWQCKAKVAREASEDKISFFCQKNCEKWQLFSSF